MAITESMHPILQEIERAYSEAHRRVRNVEFWEEEHWGIIDDAFMSANNRIAALDAQVERLQEELDSHREYSSEMLQSAWLFRVAFSGYRTLDNGDRIKRARDRLFRSIDPHHASQRKANESLATAGPGGGVVGDEDG